MKFEAEHVAFATTKQSGDHQQHRRNKRQISRPKDKGVLGYPTSVVEGVGDEFISVRESIIS